MEDQIEAVFQFVHPVPQACPGWDPLAGFCHLWSHPGSSEKALLVMTMATVDRPGGTVSPVCLLSYLFPRQASRKGRREERKGGREKRKEREEGGGQEEEEEKDHKTRWEEVRMAGDRLEYNG